MYYVVTDDKGYAFLVEANTPGEAVTSVRGGESVRIAQQIDVERYSKKEGENA